MRFRIVEEVFAALPTVCFGVVVGEGINQDGLGERSVALLRLAAEEVRVRMADVRPKEHPGLVPYREAFRQLGLNPNRFPSSIEALVNRVVKGGELPDVNPVVNVVNALCLRYLVPMGAHDLDTVEGDLEVRFSRAGDRFIPFGETEAEAVEPGELVYADAEGVRTRRWIWRQGSRGMITPASSRIFFPIDGFEDANRQAVLAAREDLARLLAELFGARVKTYYLDSRNPEADLG
ncbi:MAG: phenylalanine--tRNA ligase beta subunit-related protein [Clostridia bacterium]|nr:phenylalanine--tRNA ligase beta subunit-related protein [Clostridia bacterium]MDH7572578.1 phenylalanine--tRNA ligase beta subunit-related protein [Clostridia bacterium]